MTFEEAKALLSTLHRDRCVDHTFGDEEVSWHDTTIDPELHGNLVAAGYFSSARGTSGITIYSGKTDDRGVMIALASFEGAEAKALHACYETTHTTRNDDPASAVDR